LDFLTGVVSKAKEGLAKSKSRVDVKASVGEPVPTNAKAESVVKSDSEQHWDYLVSNLQRSLEICDLDFTDLKESDDENEVLENSLVETSHPPPMPPMTNGHPPPPPGKLPPPPLNGMFSSSKGPPAPPVFGVSLKQLKNGEVDTNSVQSSVKKTKKTVKLFWKEVKNDAYGVVVKKNQPVVDSIWNEIEPVQIDTQRFEHLFESRAKDLMNKVNKNYKKFIYRYNAKYSILLNN